MVSPVYVFSKSTPGRFKLIHNLGYPEQNSVHCHIDVAKKFVQYCSLIEIARFLLGHINLDWYMAWSVHKGKHKARACTIWDDGDEEQNLKSRKNLRGSCMLFWIELTLLRKQLEESCKINLVISEVQQSIEKIEQEKLHQNLIISGISKPLRRICQLLQQKQTN